MRLDAARTLSFVMRSELLGALPKAKLTLCSRSSSSVTTLLRDASKRRTNSGSGAVTFSNCLRSAIEYGSPSLASRCWLRHRAGLASMFSTNNGTRCTLCLLGIVRQRGRRSMARPLPSRRDVRAETWDKRDYGEGGECVGEPAYRRCAGGSFEDHLRRCEAVRGEFSTVAIRFARTCDGGSGRDALIAARLGVVARDGIEGHYTGVRLPLTGLRLDPRLDLAA